MKTIMLAFLVLLAASCAVAGFDPTQFVASARSQIGVTSGYDGSYRKLTYPGGDVPRETGVCCDVVVRALREQNMDLQQLVHEDMKRSFNAYPQNWGLKKPDPNIDHRRVPNCQTSCLVTLWCGNWSMDCLTSASSLTGGIRRGLPWQFTTSAEAPRKRMSCSASRSPVTSE
jgi:hypothetical protein